MRDLAKDHGIILTAGYGPTADQNLSSPDPNIVKNAKEFFTGLIKQLEKMDIHSIGGGLNSYWPVDYSNPIDKRRDWEIGVHNVREVAKVAQDCGIDYCLECLNRFEGYLLNTAAEGVAFCEEVGLPNVKLLLDTFHMNIEEDSFYDAILRLGSICAGFIRARPTARCPEKAEFPGSRSAMRWPKSGMTGTW